MTKRRQEIATYDTAYGDRIRIVIDTGDELSPVYWLCLKADGSVYTGPRLIKVSEHLHGVARQNEGGDYVVTAEDGQPVTDPDVLGDVNTSFHGSGVVNSPSVRVFRDPIRDLRDQQWPCFVGFQPFDRYEVISRDKVRPRDVCLRYPVNDNCPVMGYVFVAPKGQARPVNITNALYQINLMFEYKVGNEIDDMVVQVVLFHGPTGPWPSYTYFAFGAQSPEPGG